MGSCFSASVFLSSSSVVGDEPTVKVITLDGKLIEYSMPVNVMQVLDANYWSCFVCDVDAMLYDRYIPALDFAEWLQLQHIYFVLPNLLLDRPLTGQDMAALAVKASCALDSAMDRIRQRRGTPRVMPALEVNDTPERIKSRRQYKIEASRRAWRGFEAAARLSTITEAE